MRIRQIDLFKKVQAWIAISEAQKSVHIRMGIPADRIHVVPHFLDVPATEPAEIKGEGYALFLGRLSPEKGVAQLLEAWPQVKYPGARLVIAGKGPEEEKLRKFIRANRLSNVEFRGFVAPGAQSELWAGARFLVAPSIWEEPFGLVVLEAWAHGRPVVTSDRGSFPEMIGAGGLLCSPERPTEMAAVITRMFESTDLISRMASAGQKRLRTDYCRETWIKRIRSVYQHCGLTF
jgi:glycosyltransferase involved in cell wall biosynthesis